MQHLAAIAIAVFVWWFATGAVLIAARRAEISRWPAFIAVSLLAAVSFAALAISADMQTAAGAYLGFFGALGIWTWHEMTFLTGLITGPSRAACPPDLGGWARFRAAFWTVSSHEGAILASGLAIFVLLHDAANATGLWLFLLLWLMRISAKLTVFTGAPNAVSAMMPVRIAYMASYFRTDRIGPFLVAGLVFGFGGLVLISHAAMVAEGAHLTVALVLVATFLALAVIEHLFLALPVRDTALWAWALPGSNDPVSAKKRHTEMAGSKNGDTTWM